MDHTSGVESLEIYSTFSESVMSNTFPYYLDSHNDRRTSGEALLACGISDGSIVLMRVHQKLEQQPSLTPFGCNITIHCEAELLDIKASIADGKGITALAWVTTSLKLVTRNLLSFAQPLTLKSLFSRHSSRRLFMPSQVF